MAERTFSFAASAFEDGKLFVSVHQGEEQQLPTYAFKQQDNAQFWVDPAITNPQGRTSYVLLPYLQALFGVKRKLPSGVNPSTITVGTKQHGNRSIVVSSQQWFPIKSTLTQTVPKAKSGYMCSAVPVSFVESLINRPTRLELFDNPHQILGGIQLGAPNQPPAAPVPHSPDATQQVAAMLQAAAVAQGPVQAVPFHQDLPAQQEVFTPAEMQMHIDDALALLEDQFSQIRGWLDYKDESRQVANRFFQLLNRCENTSAAIAALSSLKFIDWRHQGWFDRNIENARELRWVPPIRSPRRFFIRLSSGVNDKNFHKYDSAILFSIVILSSECELVATCPTGGMNCFLLDHRKQQAQLELQLDPFGFVFPLRNERGQAMGKEFIPCENLANWIQDRWNATPWTTFDYSLNLAPASSAKQKEPPSGDDQSGAFSPSYADQHLSPSSPYGSSYSYSTGNTPSTPQSPYQRTMSQPAYEESEASTTFDPNTFLNGGDDSMDVDR